MRKSRGLDRREFLGTLATAFGALAWGVGAPRASGAAALDEVARFDGLGQADLVRRGELSARELVEGAIARIEGLDAKLGAVVTPLFERGLRRVEAGLPDGPFTGVPYLLKDLLPYEGARVTFGSRFHRDTVLPYTPVVAERMEAAGLVVLGKTNTPEFGLLPTTEPALHGPTRNPWSLAHSPGGSSGGAAAAVAAGLVPLAQGSDGGGSIRIPASACGVFGLKPSRGRQPQSPEVDAHGLGVRHCLSRSVRDSAALLDATRGPVRGDRWWAPPAEGSYREAARQDPSGLRIGFMTADFVARPAHAECRKAVEETARRCEALGHAVEEARPEVAGEAFLEAFLLLWASFAGRAVKAATRALGKRPPQEAFETWTWELAALEGRHTPADVSSAWQQLGGAGFAMARFHERYDLLLTPVLGAPPLRTGELDQEIPFEAFRDRVTEYAAYTPLANATGQPAMSVPLHWSDEGLPIGSQFVARYGDEATLFALAGQLERAHPWAQRWPGVAETEG
jgi:amidase